MLLSYKPLHLEAQQRLQEEGCAVDINRQAIKNKWIFKKKTDADGNVTVYKARLVAKGFPKVQGVDYERPSHP